MDAAAFSPNWPAGTVNIALTASNQTVAFPAPNVGNQLRVVNNTNQVAFVNVGAAGVVASITTGAPVLPSSVEVFTIDALATTVAAIGTATNGTVYFTRGFGL
jgi:hypothetical protein